MKKIVSFFLSLVLVISLAYVGDCGKVKAASNPYPTTQDMDGDGFYEVPCTRFAWQQAYDRCGKALPAWGNAAQWWNNARNAGYSTGSTPAANSIAVWSGGYGHVAFVTSGSGNTFVVDEGGRTDYDQTNSHGVVYGYKLTNSVGSPRPYDEAKTLLGFIYLNSTPAPVITDYKPDGYVDRVTSSAGRLEIWGWAFDRDSLSSAVPVHVYIDGPAGSGRLLCDGSANEARSDINKAFNVGGNHGYTINIPTKITGNHTLYVYAINIGKDGKPNNGENPLIGSKTVNIQGDNTAPVISDAKVIDKDSTGYTVQCKVTDNIGVNRVQCPTWTEKNDQDDIAKDWGTNASVKAKSMGNGVYQFRVNISDHNNEYGLYKTHIYAYDDCGNQTNSNLNHIEVVYMDISTRWDSLLPAGKDAFVGKAIIKTGDAKKYKTQKIITSVNKDGKMIEKVIDIPTDSSKADSWAGAFFVVDRRDFDNANGKYTTTYVVEEVNGNVWKKSMTYDFDEYPDDVKITLTKGEIYDLNMNSIIKSFFQNPPHGSKPILKKVMCYQSEGLSDGEVEIDLDNMALSGTKKGRVYLTLFNYGDNSSKDKIVIVDITDNESNDAEVPNVSMDSIANISGVTFTPSNDKISFRWIGVDDATGYELQSSLNSDLTDGKTVSWKNAKAVYNGGNWTGLKENTTYYFRIRAYKGDGEDRVYSDWTDIMTATTKKSEDVEDTPNKLDKVTNITYTASATQVNFKWTGVSDATGYQLQNSFNKDLSDSVIVSWNGAKYVYNGGNWTGLKEGTTYYFRIRAYKGDGDDRVYSDWTDVMTVTTQKATPVTNNTSATTPSTTEQKPSNYNYPSSTYDTISVPKIKLTKLKSKKKGQIAVSWDWEIVDGYQIWYSRDRDFYRYYSKRINWLKSGGTLKGLSKGKRYYVKVRGYKEDKYGDRVYGSWSNVKSVKVKK